MAEKFTTLCSSCFQETINMLSSSKQLNRCIIPATFNLGCVFVFFFFRMMSVIIMVGFLFTICIVLLNILIAQVSDTFQDVQQDAQREYEVTRASIVTRMQGDLFFVKLKIYYFSLRTNYEISQIWSP